MPVLYRHCTTFFTNITFNQSVIVLEKVIFKQKHEASEEGREHGWY